MKTTRKAEAIRTMIDSLIKANRNLTNVALRTEQFESLGVRPGYQYGRVVLVESKER